MRSTTPPRPWSPGWPVSRTAPRWCGRATTARCAASPMPSSAPPSSGRRPCSPLAGCGRATASGSCCRCSPRRRSRSSPLACSRPSTRRSSRATARRPWRRGCVTLRRRSSSPPTASCAAAPRSASRRRPTRRSPRRPPCARCWSCAGWVIAPARCPGRAVAMPGGTRRWPTRRSVDASHAAPTDPETPYMLIYTSGTTGRPKGAVHVHGGFPIKGAQDLAHSFDLGRGDVLFWFTDLGWMMGPWAISGALLLGATLVLYEGVPDYPGPDRLWALVERHRVTHLGLSPTVIRALMAHGRGAGARARSLEPAGPWLDRRAVEPGALVVVLPRGRRRPLPDHQLQRRHGGLRRHRQREPADADQAVRLSVDQASARPRTSSGRMARASAGWSGSWSSGRRCRA